MDSNRWNLLQGLCNVTISTWTPISQIITNVTQANPGVVTTAQPHAYFDGLYVRIDMYSKPNLFGMTQLSGNVYLITVLTDTTFSIDEDTTNFDAFVAATNPQSAQVVPVGEVATTLDNAEKNTLTPYGG